MSREEIMEDYCLTEEEMVKCEEAADNTGYDLCEIVSGYVQCKWEIEEPDDMW